MENYKKQLARRLADIGALFFDRDLVLKDGRPTPYFVNMAMFKTGKFSLELGSFFAGMIISQGLVENIDIILGPSYKGSSIALATSIALWNEHKYDLLYDYDRKEAKTHGEASASKSLFVNRTFFDGCRIFIVDDVATSMNTKIDLLEKIEGEAQSQGISCHVAGIGIGIDREQTTAIYDKDNKPIAGQKGKNAIYDFVSKSGVPVYAVAGIREIIEYIYQEKIPVMIEGAKMPVNKKTKAEFDEYIKIYGVA